MSHDGMAVVTVIFTKVASFLETPHIYEIFLVCLHVNCATYLEI